MAQQRAPDRELLLANHQFPGEYTIKAFGPGHEQFVAEVHRHAVAIVGERYAARTRFSSGGNRTCVTVQLTADSVDEVIAVYEGLYTIPELFLIL